MPRPPAGGKTASGGCKSTPVATPDMIYLGMASKIGGQELGPMWGVRPGASGDISLKADETSNQYVAWFRMDAGPHFSSAVVYQDRLYVFPAHGGVLACFDANTGEVIYQKRISGAGDFMTSPWANDGKVFNTDASGLTHVIRAGSEFELLDTNDLYERCWSTPAAASGSLVIRTMENLFCIRRPLESGNR